MRLVISQMLCRVLPKVDLGTILAEIEGIGYAIRYGLIRATPEALDYIEGTEAFVALAQRGCTEEGRQPDPK